MADDERSVLFDRIEGDLAGVEQALARLDAGTYFTCEVCATPLGDEQLVADPLGSRCERCTGGPTST